MSHYHSYSSRHFSIKSTLVFLVCLASCSLIFVTLEKEPKCEDWGRVLEQSLQVDWRDRAREAVTNDQIHFLVLTPLSNFAPGVDDREWEGLNLRQYKRVTLGGIGEIEMCPEYHGSLADLAVYIENFNVAMVEHIVKK